MPSIQAAVDAAQEGDTVLLSDGLFTGPGNRGILVSGKNVRIRGPSGPEATIIDCERQARGIRFEGQSVTEKTLLLGITIRNGDPFSDTTNGLGGGALVTGGAHPTIKDCVFDSCVRNGLRYAYNNQGVLPLGQVQDCLFLDNSSKGAGGTGGSLDGGGFWGGAVIVERCTFLGNTAIVGGAARITHILRDCLISGNVATDFVNAGSGGGVQAFLDARIEGCTFVGNTANSVGGAISVEPSTTVISNCIFWGNSARFFGQQIWQNAVTFGTTETVIRYCDVDGGLAGIETDPLLFNEPLIEHLLEAAPLFLDPAAGDYGLAPASPCRDAGDPGTLGAGRGDMDQQPRVEDGRIDMGCDEVWDRPVLGLVAPGFAGMVNGVRVDHAPPGSLVAFFWGSLQGPLAIPFGICPGLQLAIQDAQLLDARLAGPDGSVRYRQHVPAGAAGVTVLLQAVVVELGVGCSTTDLLSHSYP